MHYNSIESVARLRDILEACVRQEVLANGDGAQVSRMLALQAGHEVLHQPTGQIWILAVRLLYSQQCN